MSEIQFSLCPELMIFQSVAVFLIIAVSDESSLGSVGRGVNSISSFVTSWPSTSRIDNVNFVFQILVSICLFQFS